ncbi:MAG: hypothetical protein Q8L48_42005 [Archangium sp.]|nr:hypothetical protein [Archangium sp.]
MTRSLLVASAILASSCLTSPGGGTGTFFVTARLTSDGSTAGSRARVTVRQGSSTGDLVKNAEVAIRGGSLGRTIVPYDDQRDQYRLDSFSWVEGFRLEVIRGNELLDGAIEAPGATLITDPISDSTYRRADGPPLLIRWKDSRNAGASTTRLRLDKANLDKSIPSGVYEVRVDPNELVVSDKEKVRLERSNEVNLAGGVGGSVLSASTEHEIEFRVE